MNLTELQKDKLSAYIDASLVGELTDARTEHTQSSFLHVYAPKLSSAILAWSRKEKLSLLPAETTSYAREWLQNFYNS